MSTTCVCIWREFFRIQPYVYVSARIKNTEDPLCRFHGPYLESTKAVRVLDEWNQPKSPLHTHYAYGSIHVER